MTHCAHILLYRICTTCIQRISHGCGPCATCVLLVIVSCSPGPHRVHRSSSSTIQGPDPVCWHTPDPEDLRYLGIWVSPDLDRSRDIPYRDSRPRIHGSQVLGPEALILWMSHLCAHWHSVALPSPVGSWESVCVSGRHSLALWVLGVSSSSRRRSLSWAVADSHPDP